MSEEIFGNRFLEMARAGAEADSAIEEDVEECWSIVKL